MFPRDMNLDERSLTVAVAALAALVAVLGVWLALLHRSAAALRRRLRRVLPEGGSSGLDEVLDRHFERIDQLTERVDALNALHRELEEVTRRSIQKVGIVRFNPFADTGGDQSFAIALLDSNGTGVVISSLHGRTDTRVFAKQVVAGRSRHQLSEEEQEAIQRALVHGGAAQPMR